MSPESQARKALRAELGQAAYNKLLEVERAIEAAYSAAADLAADLPRWRSGASLSPIVGHDAIDSATSMVGHLSAALGAACATHGSLAGVGARVGYRATGAGVPDKAEEDKPRVVQLDDSRRVA